MNQTIDLVEFNPNSKQFKRACYWKETPDFITNYNMLRLPLLILVLNNNLKKNVSIRKTINLIVKQINTNHYYQLIIKTRILLYYLAIYYGN